MGKWSLPASRWQKRKNRFAGEHSFRFRLFSRINFVWECLCAALGWKQGCAINGNMVLDSMRHYGHGGCEFETNVILRPGVWALPCSSFSAVRGFSMGKRETNTLGKTGNFQKKGEINFSCILSKMWYNSPRTNFLNIIWEKDHGEVSEWSKVLAWKAGVRE